MRVPIFHGLTPLDLIRPVRSEASCFPFNAPHRHYFYRARNAIYYLFRALRSTTGPLLVLVPDYNSGNEVLAMQQAGATIQYCPVGRDMQLDPAEVERLCRIHRPDVLYVIHYAGWPQPMPALVDLCERRHMLLVEDCALALFSEVDGRPLGSFGDWSIFCLYKTLPLPNGAVLVHNTTTALKPLERLRLRQPGAASVIGRSAELFVQRLRGRVETVGSVLQMMKRGLGRTATALDVHRANVGDIGFNLVDVDVAMSAMSARLLERLDFDVIRRRRIENFRLMSERLDRHVARALPDPGEGVCPLFFPILVPDKRAAVEALKPAGVEALEFWNDSVEPGGAEMSEDARFLRAHVLELPIHQDLTSRQVAYMAEQVSRLNLRTSNASHRIHAA